MTTYREFLDAHRSRANRVGHLIALVSGIAAAAVAVSLWGWPWFLVAFPIIGIGGGLSHRYFEGNSPAFYKRPWEIPVLLAYDVRMGLETLCRFWRSLVIVALIVMDVWLAWLLGTFRSPEPPIHRGGCYDLQIRPDGVLVQTMHDDCVCKDCICAPDDCRCMWERIDPSELPDDMRSEIERDQKQLMDDIVHRLQEKP